MTLLLPYPRPRMGLEQETQRRRCVDACRLGDVELNAAEMLDTHKAILARADQSGRRTMVTVERTASRRSAISTSAATASSIEATDR